MKNRINKTIFVLAMLVLFATSCQWEPIMWDESKTYIAFNTPATVIPEEGGDLGIVVMVTALDGAPAVDVTFQLDTVGIAPEVAAIEGEQYVLVNADQSLSYPEGWGYDTIWIRPIDNDVFTGDKYFNVTLTSNTEDYQFGAMVTNVITIKDNEHPLAAWIGTYAVEALSYGNPGAWDEAWTVTTAPVEGDVTKLSITGMSDGELPVIATVDQEAMTITLPGGADTGTGYGWEHAYIAHSDYNSFVNEGEDVVGTIDEDGTIHIDELGILVTDDDVEVYIWDAFNTTWTKTAKKSVGAKTPGVDKATRIN